MAIPKRIHQIWIQGWERLPRRYRKQSLTWRWRNPDWRYRLWDDAALSRLIAKHCPELKSIYDVYDEAVARADIGRYVLLDAFGGLYVDMDTVCVRPIGDALSEPGMSLYAQVYDNPLWRAGPDDLLEHVSNALIATTAGHPIWPLVFRRIVADEHPQYFFLLSTGPEMFRACLERYMAAHDDVRFLTREEVITAFYLSRHYMRWAAWRGRDVFAIHYNDSARPEWRPSFKSWLWPTLPDMSLGSVAGRRLAKWLANSKLRVR